MVKKGDTTRLRLPKSRLQLGVLCFVLLLTVTLFGVVQASGVSLNCWAGEVTVVNDADVSIGYFSGCEGSWQILSEVVTTALPNQPLSLPLDLVINEFMANNDAAVPGTYNDYPDWIEIYNGGTGPRHDRDNNR